MYFGGLLLLMGNFVGGILFFVGFWCWNWYIDCVFFDIIGVGCSCDSVLDICYKCLVIF